MTSIALIEDDAAILHSLGMLLESTLAVKSNGLTPLVRKLVVSDDFRAPRRP